MSNVYVCTVETESFTFEAAAFNATKARAAVRAAMDEHGKREGLKPKWYRGEYDMPVRRLVIGAGYRDHDRLAEPVK